MPPCVLARPRSEGPVQVCASTWNADHLPPFFSEANETGTEMAPAFWTASTPVVPVNRSLASPSLYGAVMVTGGFVRPGLLCSLALPLDGWVTTQMLPPGPITASISVPKLGAVATSAGAESGPPDCEVAVAISLPCGPFSEAVVSWNQTRVTRPPGVASTRRPTAEESPSESTAWMPPRQLLAPRGRVHRFTLRPLPVSPIQPM